MHCYFWNLTCVLLWSSTLSDALSTTGNRLLVVIDTLADRANFTTLWSDLENRGFDISYETPKSESLTLFDHGQRRYDHLILLPPKSKGYGPSLSSKELLDFMREQGNIMLALAGNVAIPHAVVSLLGELDVHLPASRTSGVIDHFKFESSSLSESHDILMLPKPLQALFDLDDSNAGHIVFPRSVGQQLGQSSDLVVPILTAEDTAYTFDPKKDTDSVVEPFAVGRQIALVSAVQARNSARFTIWGSVEALQDRWFDTVVTDGQGERSRTLNRQFVEKVTAWTFQEIGVLRVGDIKHCLAQPTALLKPNELGAIAMNSSLNPLMYRIKNDVDFFLEVSEYNMDHDLPFTPHVVSDILQLEVSMLSPFYRLNLEPLSATYNGTVFHARFRLPDQHGIFKFQVSYKRPLYTSLDVSQSVTVRHFAHDEWPRSWQISGGRVWIAGLWMTILGWSSFTGFWLWSKPTA